jgi:hypothetical protein
MTTVFAFDAGETIVQDAAIKITIDDLTRINTEEAVLSGEALIIDLLKFLKVILNAPVILGILRFGADRVRIVYRRSRDEMPARSAEIHHAEEEGIELHLLTAPTRFLGDGRGRVIGVECIQMKLGDPDASGRRSPVPIEDSKFRLECDLAVIAVGAGTNPLLTTVTPGLKLNKWG